VPKTRSLIVSDHVVAVFPRPFEFGEVVATVREAIAVADAGTLYPTFFGFLRRGRHTGGEGAPVTE